MQSIELVLDFSLYIIWYSFFTFFIFDFLLGLFALMKESFATPLVPKLVQTVNPQLTQLQPVLKTEDGKLPQAEASIVPKSKSDEATIQYLEMKGCDINDFQSIAQARKFLDEHASWTIETASATQAGQLLPKFPTLPDPWIEPLEEGKLQQVQECECKPLKIEPCHKQAAGKNLNLVNELQVSELQSVKLTFKQVCIEFAQAGLALERYRSGHYCYRIIFGHDSPCRFKTLQEALDWLAVNKQSMQAVVTN